MGIVRKRVQGSLTKAWVSKESLSGRRSEMGRILCPVSSSVSRGAHVQEMKEVSRCPGSGVCPVCSHLPWQPKTTQFLIFFRVQYLVFSHLPQVLGPTVVSCLPQGPGSDVLGALLTFLCPEPGVLSSWNFLAGFRSPVCPFGSFCPLPAKLVPGIVNFYDHCGERPPAGCTLFILFVAVGWS